MKSSESIKQHSKKMNISEGLTQRIENFKQNIPKIMTQSQSMNKPENIKPFNQNNSYQFLIKYSVKTKPGKDHMQRTKTNQDNFYIKTNLWGDENNSIFLVFDGHGPDGHKVSEYLKSELGERLISENSIGFEPKEVFECIQNGCKIVNEKLEESNIDSINSGSTCSGIIIIGSNFYSLNIGDSRTILGKVQKEELKSEQITKDQIPTREDERKRILEKGGRVHPYRDENGTPQGPARIWLPKKMIPGLAMSRSFGDSIIKNYGKTCEPEIRVRKITENDKSIIIASDGVWEFISNNDAISIVHPFWKDQRPELASNKLIRVATSMWRREDDVIDDITSIVIYFYPKT